MGTVFSIHQVVKQVEHIVVTSFNATTDTVKNKLDETVGFFGRDDNYLYVKIKLIQKENL
ncbi:hypothetical protein BpHYR1_017967 [Brachionus plicatilis]|uniref:Uncharacterized protein n=1 Tax=Brachionus plicatilis TaxID=10195 RepID=A0A3M7R6Q5_BRAPC|nr:hypothetical protein BpHYR1_017967 [Brachionus plicatilis]